MKKRLLTPTCNDDGIPQLILSFAYFLGQLQPEGYIYQYLVNIRLSVQITLFSGRGNHL